MFNVVSSTLWLWSFAWNSSFPIWQLSLLPNFTSIWDFFEVNMFKSCHYWLCRLMCVVHGRLHPGELWAQSPTLEWEAVVSLPEEALSSWVWSLVSLMEKKKKGCLRTCHRFWYSVDFFVEHHQHSFKNLILAELGEGRLGKEGLGQMVVMWTKFQGLHSCQHISFNLLNGRLFYQVISILKITWYLASITYWLAV